jgi:hypothetical protein
LSILSFLQAPLSSSPAPQENLDPSAGYESFLPTERLFAPAKENIKGIWPQTKTQKWISFFLFLVTDTRTGRSHSNGVMVKGKETYNGKKEEEEPKEVKRQEEIQ